MATFKWIIFHTKEIENLSSFQGENTRNTEKDRKWLFSLWESATRERERELSFWHVLIQSIFSTCNFPLASFIHYKIELEKQARASTSTNYISDPQLIIDALLPLVILYLFQGSTMCALFGDNVWHLFSLSMQINACKCWDYSKSVINSDRQNSD